MSITQPFAASASYQAIRERDEALAELERAREGVTVCVTYHNEPDEVLWRALDSAVTQTVRPFEVIIIDDGSERPPVGISRDSHGFPMRVVTITNRGLPAARNTGLMLAKTVGFLPLDADDWLEPTYVEKTLPLLLDGADVVLTGLQEHGPTRNGTYFPGYNKPFDQVTVDDLWRTNLFYYCSLFRTETLREIGGYNPLMAGPWNRRGGHEDHDVWLDLMTRGARFACCMDVLFNYSTANSQSMIHNVDYDALMAEMKRHHRRP